MDWLPTSRKRLLGVHRPPDQAHMAAAGRSLPASLVGALRRNGRIRGATRNPEVVVWPVLAAPSPATCGQDHTLPTNALVPAATALLNANEAPQVRAYRHLFVDELQDSGAGQMELDPRRQGTSLVRAVRRRRREARDLPHPRGGLQCVQGAGRPQRARSDGLVSGSRSGPGVDARFDEPPDCDRGRVVLRAKDCLH